MSFRLFCLVMVVAVVDKGNGTTCDNVPVTTQNECRKYLDMRPGLYYCQQPGVDTQRQSEEGCRSNGTVLVQCFAGPNVSCGGETFDGNQCTFTKEQPCRYVKLCDGDRPCYNYYVAVGLSLFLGMFGIDRFYLGYPAIGLAKLCTLGFLFIGQLVDFLLILVQAVGPADRSSYYTPFYGPILREVNSSDPYLPVSDQPCA